MPEYERKEIHSMKLNLDCMRSILLEAEQQPFGQELLFTDLTLKLSKYSEDELAYTCIKLKEAGFITAVIIQADNFSAVQFIDDITYEGHQFLANIRSDTIWNDVKEVSKKVGSNSLQAISQIATAVITAIINNQLGFTP